jgi:hypothetical protein
MKKKNIVGLIAIVTIVAMVIFTGCLEDPKNIVVNIQSPSFVNEKEDFNIIVTVENTDEKPQKLVSLDIADSYLESISITNSEPQYKSNYHVPIDNTRCYEYHIDIPANGKQIVKLTAVALEKGDYSGDIDICINSEMNFLSMQLRTIVE